jgi:hypothetical protein
MAKEYKKPRHTERNMPLAETGVEGRPPDRGKPSIVPVNIIGSENGTTTECVSMKVNVSNGSTLFLLESPEQPDNLDKTRQFHPEAKVKGKSVSGSTIETMVQ